MNNPLTNFIKTKPRLFDIAKRALRTLPHKKDANYQFFDDFSKSHNGYVSFVQVGASDGLRWDPIREFIVRDKWEGIFIEPLPSVFEVLKNNYRYLEKKSKLVFVNAAISSDAGNLMFWTVEEAFLNKLSVEDRIIYSQKSSFDKEHVLRWIKSKGHQNSILKEIRIPCLTLSEVARNHWNGRSINLLVIDAEGHEASIIQSIDFNVINPDSIFFESHNLGSKKSDVYALLSQHSYELKEIGGDTIASHRNGPGN